MRRPALPHRALAPAALAVGALLAASCASDPAAPPAGEEDASAPRSRIPEGAEIVSDTLTAKVDAGTSGTEFGRTLLATDRRVDEYVALATQPGADARERRDLAKSALEAIAAQHLDAFLALAGDASEPTRRRIAMKALAFSDDARATPLLVNGLADENDVLLQTNAAFALARRADPASPVADLLRACGSDDADVRVNSLLALWHVLDARRDAGQALVAAERDRALAVVETALFDPQDAMVRGHAAAAMGALGDPRGVDPLLNLLRDKHPLVRTHTALALGKLGDLRALRPLVDVIDDTQRGTARGAVILGVSVLLEKAGVQVPAHLPDDQRAWSDLVRRSLPAQR